MSSLSRHALSHQAQTVRALSAALTGVRQTATPTNTQTATTIPPYSLRDRLNQDVEANRSRLLQEALSGHTDTSSSSAASASRTNRQNTLSLAARLAKHIECQLDFDHPRYLENAMQPTTQSRLVVEAQRPPYTVIHASQAFCAMANKTSNQLVGKPVLDVMQDLGVSSKGNSSIVNSLRLKQRDCGAVAVGRGNKPSRMVISPLLTSKDGQTNHMLFVIN